MKLRSVAVAFALTVCATGLLAQGPKPTPVSLWHNVLGVINGKRLLPGSKRFQPGSRNADYYTIDGVNAIARSYVLKHHGVVQCSNFPNGSLLIKQNYDVSHKLVNITAMLKCKGYDTADNDWVMANYSPAGKAIAFGKVALCINCHAIAAKSDTVFAPPPANLLSPKTIHVYFPAKKITIPYLKLLKKYPHSIMQ